MSEAIAAAFDQAPAAHVEKGLAATLLTPARLIAIGAALKATRKIGGCTAEVGIAAGGTTRLIAAGNGARTHFACDTFDGLMDCGPDDVGLTNKMFQNVRPPVEAALADLANVALVEGYFPESATPEMAESLYSFVHIDTDTYASIHAAFAFFAPRMMPGGMIAIDDVLPDRSGCPGAQKAWREIVAGRDASRWWVSGETPPAVMVTFR